MKWMDGCMIEKREGIWVDGWMVEWSAAVRWMEEREWMDVGGCEWMDGWSEVGSLVDKMDRSCVSWWLSFHLLNCR
jgi:hypothetical protein